MNLPFLKKLIPEAKPKKEEAISTTIKNLIAPSALEINSNFLKIGKKFARTIFISSYPRYLGTGWFSPVINLDKPMDISVFVHPVETNIALRNLRKQVARVQSQINIHEEKGMVRDPILETALQDIENLRDQLQQAREKLFSAGVYITFFGDSVQELYGLENAIRSLLEGRMVYTKQALFQQLEGLNSALPLGQDELGVRTTMNTGPLSTFFPFISADLTSDKGILYGINRHNNSLILFDRFSMENYNLVIFAKSGAGKSYASKLEILRSLMIGTDVIIIDPEKEYKYLCETVGGTFFHVSLTSEHHINPFDLPPVREDETPADVLRSNVVNIIGLLRMMLGGLTPEEDAVIDKAVAETYASRDITPDTKDFSKMIPPVMNDLQTVLSGMEGAKSLAIRLSKYTEGSYSGFFNQPTNVEVKNRLVVFNIRDMEEELRPLAMYVILHFIWNLVRTELRRRIVVVDEAWLMMRHEDAASFMFGLVKRARKYYLGVTTITQDIEDFMSSKFGHPIVTNSSLALLLNQSPAMIDYLVKTLNLTQEEKFILLESDVGEGLFLAGRKHAAIKIVASYTEDQIITTDPEKILQIEQAKKELAAAEQKVV
ncbi:MAG: ATP-binding protein [bacterium]|nr:ATP-binding protein [bacterium]